ncbi:hypothetical protein MTBSS4_640007 [Magnetospirillum sp. SS-4]|nr:hypothetical protein MTBSS4_640007 [Magnetospirillum sp. SS-4]
MELPGSISDSTCIELDLPPTIHQRLEHIESMHSDAALTQVQFDGTAPEKGGTDFIHTFWNE